MLNIGQICSRIKMFNYSYASFDEMVKGRRQVAIDFLKENDALPIGDIDRYLYEDLIHFCGKVLDKQIWL
jgi:hypothetical protein